MQKNNRSPSKLAPLLVALRIGVLPTQSLEKLSADSIKKLKTSFLNTPEGIEDIFKKRLAGYTSVEDADYTPIRKLRANLNLKSEPVR